MEISKQCRHADEESWVPLPDGTYNYGETSDWYSSDTEQIFDYNMSIPENREILENCGHSKTSIEYSINEWGFRTKNFTTGQHLDSAIALGCSCTFGLGLPEKDTWPYKLSQLMDMEVYNLGVCGMGYETNFRTLEYWLPRLRSKYVFMLVNPGIRREYFNMHSSPPHYQTLGSWNLGSRSKDYTEREVEMFLNEKDGMISKSRSLWAIKGLCDYYDVKLDIIDPYPEETIEGLTRFLLPLGWHDSDGKDCARDLQHPGAVYNQKIAENFAYQNGN